MCNLRSAPMRQKTLMELLHIDVYQVDTKSHAESRYFERLCVEYGCIMDVFTLSLGQSRFGLFL